jgi:sulfate adenylyltransferase subunit 2
LVRLAQKHSFHLKFLSIITCGYGHNFPETIEFRDRLVKELGLELIVRNVQDAIDEGKVVEDGEILK